MISASAVTKRHELIMSLVAGLSPIMQGGCEAKPDYDKVWKRAVMSPYASTGRPKASLPRPGSPCLR